MSAQWPPRAPSGRCAACGVRLESAPFVGIGELDGRSYIFLACEPCGLALVAGDENVHERVDQRAERGFAVADAPVGGHA